MKTWDIISYTNLHNSQIMLYVQYSSYAIW